MKIALADIVCLCRGEADCILLGGQQEYGVEGSVGQDLTVRNKTVESDVRQVSTGMTFRTARFGTVPVGWVTEQLYGTRILE